MKRRSWLPARWGWAVLVIAPVAASAQGWSAEHGTQARLQHDTNPGLAAAAAPRVAENLLQWLGHARLQRRSDAAESEAEAAFTLGRRWTESQAPGGADDNAQGRLVLRQRLRGERHSALGSLVWRREQTLDAADTSAAEAALGRQAQTVSEAGLDWTYAWHERWRSELGWSQGLTRYARLDTAGPAANPGYRLNGLSLAGRWDWTERSTLSLSAGRTVQALQQAAAARTEIDSLRLGLSHAASERLSFNLSVAQSRTTQQATRFGFACPLPVQFCQAGIVAPVPTQEAVRVQRREGQYSASGRWLWGPRLGLAAAASRTLTPGPAGVDREDRGSLSAEFTASETWRTALLLSHSGTQAALPAVVGAARPARARLQSLTLDNHWRLSEPWTLSLQAQWRRFDGATPGSGARAQMFSISLQYLRSTVLHHP